jgi:cell division septum initiation protein DivIVA
VSAFEPQLPTDPKVDMPDFMVVLRGFDRRQVEMWAAEVAHQIEQERQRADEAEKRAYRVQIENKGAPSFSHLGTHVASILEEAGKSSENMLADAAERAQETVDAAEEEAAEIIKAAEHRAGEIEGEARRTLEEASSEGARVEEEALQAAEEMRAQAEQDARTVLEEARDATDMIWQEAERERLGVEAETIRLETLRHRSLEQLGRVYGHLESVLDEVRAGIGRVEEETEDLDEATAAAAARLGVEPPASSPEESPRFPAPRDARPPEGEDDGDGLELRDSDDGDGLELRDDDDGDGLEQPDGDGGDGMLAATRPDTPPAPEDAEATQPVPASGTAETTQSTLPGSAAETTQPDPAVAAAETPGGDDEGPAGDQDATQRLEPVGNKPGAGKEGKPQA